MAEYDEIIKDSHKKQVRNIVMSFKETKVGQHFQQRNNQFIWIIIVFIFTAGSSWMLIKTDVKANTVYGQTTRGIVVTHIDETKGEPLSELQLQNKIDNLEDDVQDHDIKINSHDTLITEHDKSIAVQQVQYDNIIEKLDELINK